MTDKDKIFAIHTLLNALSLDNLTREQLDKKIEKMSVAKIKDTIWKLYTFVDNVCDIVNE